MILYKKYLWYISTEDAFEKNKLLTRRVDESAARLGRGFQTRLFFLFLLILHFTSDFILLMQLLITLIACVINRPT